MMAPDNAALQAKLDKAVETLSWFLADDRFVVSVSGNPIAVDEMIQQARTTLKELTND